MMKTIDIAFFFDGTGNHSRAEFPTNIFKLYSYSGIEYKKYCPGPGGNEYDIVVENAFGAGVWDRIKQMYRWLSIVHKKESQETNFRIFIFGFSRGAYTAHVFSWLLTCCGISKDIAHCDSVVECFQKYKDLAVDHLKNDNKSTNFSIELLGLFDQVKSIIPDVDCFDGKVSPSIKNIYHAMSSDEHRKDFPVLKFESTAKNVHQLWFAGVHSDVGGGYEEKGLSDIVLEWMLENALESNLLFDNKIREIIVKKEEQKLNDPFADSLLWKARGSEQRTCSSEPFHSSVSARCKKVSYTPLLLALDFQNAEFKEV